MSLANDLAKSKYRPYHRNAEGFAAAGVSIRDDSHPWLSHHSPVDRTAACADGTPLMEHKCAAQRAAKPPCGFKACSLMATLPS